MAGGRPDMSETGNTEEKLLQPVLQPGPGHGDVLQQRPYNAGLSHGDSLPHSSQAPGALDRSTLVNKNFNK